MQPNIVYRLPSSATRVALPLAFVLLGACTTAAHRSERSRPGAGHLITAAEIERSSARNVWDVLRRSDAHIDFSLDRSGRPVYVARRGQVGSAEGGGPLVVVDGIPTKGLDLLQMPASWVSSIRVLSALQATQRFGASGAAGAILIETHRGAYR